VFGQGDGADEVADHLAIQTKSARQRAGMLCEPTAEQCSQRFGIHSTQDLVKDAVAGHFVEAAGALLDRQSQRGSLFGMQAGGEAGDLGHVARAGHKRHRDEREHGPDPKAGVGPSRVGRLAQTSSIDRQRVGSRGSIPLGAATHAPAKASSKCSAQTFCRACATSSFIQSRLGRSLAHKSRLDAGCCLRSSPPAPSRWLCNMCPRKSPGR